MSTQSSVHHGSFLRIGNIIPTGSEYDQLFQYYSSDFDYSSEYISKFNEPLASITNKSAGFNIDFSTKKATINLEQWYQFNLSHNDPLLVSFPITNGFFAYYLYQSFGSTTYSFYSSKGVLIPDIHLEDEEYRTDVFSIESSTNINNIAYLGMNSQTESEIFIKIVSLNNDKQVIDLTSKIERENNELQVLSPLETLFRFDYGVYEFEVPETLANQFFRILISVSGRNSLTSPYLISQLYPSVQIFNQFNENIPINQPLFGNISDKWRVIIRTNNADVWYYSLQIKPVSLEQIDIDQTSTIVVKTLDNTYSVGYYPRTYRKISFQQDGFYLFKLISSSPLTNFNVLSYNGSEKNQLLADYRGKWFRLTKGEYLISFYSSNNYDDTVQLYFTQIEFDRFTQKSVTGEFSLNEPKIVEYSTSISEGRYIINSYLNEDVDMRIVLKFYDENFFYYGSREIYYYSPGTKSVEAPDDLVNKYYVIIEIKYIHNNISPQEEKISLGLQFTVNNRILSSNDIVLPTDSQISLEIDPTTNSPMVNVFIDKLKPKTWTKVFIDITGSSIDAYQIFLTQEPFFKLKSNINDFPEYYIIRNGTKNLVGFSFGSLSTNASLSFFTGTLVKDTTINIRVEQRDTKEIAISLPQLGNPLTPNANHIETNTIFSLEFLIVFGLIGSVGGIGLAVVVDRYKNLK
jgi:hypothetical protein